MDGYANELMEKSEPYRILTGQFADDNGWRFDALMVDNAEISDGSRLDDMQ